MLAAEILLWPFWHDAGRVDGGMAAVVVMLDVYKIHRRGRRGSLCSPHQHFILAPGLPRVDVWCSRPAGCPGCVSLMQSAPLPWRSLGDLGLAVMPLLGCAREREAGATEGQSAGKMMHCRLEGANVRSAGLTVVVAVGADAGRRYYEWS